MKRLIRYWPLIFFALVILPITSSLAQEELPQESAQGQEGKVYAAAGPESGLVTLDFEDADLRDVIRVIAMASGLNMVIGKDVEAKVTISLKEMHWEHALDIILRTYNFTYKKEENLIRIMTFEKIKQEERDIPLITKIIYLNFADAAVLQPTVSKMLSERGSIETDARTNSMLISDIPAKVEQAEKVAKKLDTRTPQVLIEAMLVDVKLTKDDELGINWSILNVNAPDNQGVDISTPTSSGNYIEAPSATMNALASTATSLNMGFLKRFGDYGIDGLVSAWVREMKANVLASPKIVTLDNQTAKIEIKSQVTYTETTQSTTGGEALSTTAFKDVVTSLEVTPHITKEGFVSMHIKPQQEFLEGNSGEVGSRSAETNVLIDDGETIVIGGLRKVEDTASVIKIPLLGDIPYLGRLFRKTDYNKIYTELVMFVTPRIIVRPKLTDQEIDRFQMLDQARGGVLEDMEKARQQRLKESSKQASVIGPRVIQKRSALREQGLEIEAAPAAAIREKKLEENAGYIYSW